ncbi:MAG: type III secretion system export apparatus subunit SctS [Burkholderiaceae bacterium]
MDSEALIRLTTEAMLLCMYISMPVVIVAAIVGLLVSFLQAITSTQDQNLSHGAKLIAVVVTIFVAAPIAGAALVNFLNHVMKIAIPS